MRRPSIVALFLLMGLFATGTLLGASGVLDAGDTDIELRHQDDFEDHIGEGATDNGDENATEGFWAHTRENVDGVVDAAHQSIIAIPVVGSFVESLHGIYTSVSDTFSSIIGAVYYGPAVLKSIPMMPGYIVDFLLYGLSVVVVLDTLYVLAGRRL